MSKGISRGSMRINSPKQVFHTQVRNSDAPLIPKDLQNQASVIADRKALEWSQRNKSKALHFKRHH